MTTSNPKPEELLDNHGKGEVNNEVALKAIEALAKAAGYKSEDLLNALEGIKTANQIKEDTKKKADEYNFFLDKTPVYDDVDAFIFKRADSKSGRYYIRMYDTKSGRPIVKSLRSSDKTQALVTARQVYIEYKGKIDRGERIKSITTAELVELYFEKLSKRVTPIPKQGITPDTFRVKKCFISYWVKYIDYLGFTNKKIDKILASQTREFCEWMRVLPKDKRYSGRTDTPRSIEQINNAASEVRLMYYKVGVRERYISESMVPIFDRLPDQTDDYMKRDILTLAQYEVLWKHLEYKYTREAGVDKKELLKRKIFKDFIGISYNLGTRPKELLNLKLKDIQIGEGWSKEKQKNNYIIHIRRENSKTGKSRKSVSPIKKRVDRIIACYKELGIDLQPEDYLFTNVAYWCSGKNRKPYGRMICFQRLRKVLIDSGLQKELDATGTNITLYSARHAYCCWRLRHGNVPIHLLAKQMGTSVNKIESTYGHILLEKEIDVITKNQGLVRSGITLDKPEVIDDDLS